MKTLFNFKLLRIIPFLGLSLGAYSQNLTAPTITSNGSTNLCNGQSVTLSTAAQTGTTYQWEKDPNWTPYGSVVTGYNDYDIVVDKNSGTIYAIVTGSQSSFGKATLYKNINGVWSVVGTSNFTSENIFRPQLQIDNLGNLFLSYETSNPAGDPNNTRVWDITVMKFNGSTWTNVGTSKFAKLASGYSFALDKNNVPYVLCDVVNGSNIGQLFKFNGTSWTIISEGMLPALISNESSMIFDNNNILYAYFNGLCKKFNGTSWDLVGNGPITVYAVYNVKLIFDQNNNLYFSGYRAYISTDKVLVYQLSNSNWTLLGNANSGVNGWLPSINIDAANNLYLAYIDYESSSGFYKTIIKRYNGTTWNNLGEISSTSNLVGFTKLIFDKFGHPVVVNFYQTTLFAYKYQGAIISSSSNTITASNSGNYIVSVSKNNQGAISPTVTISGGTPSSVSISPASSTICSGANATLTASGANSYLWTTDAGLIVGNTATIIVSPLITTTYTVTGSVNGCTNTNTVKVTVNPKPNVSATSTMVTGCIFNLIASGASSYSWSPNTGLSATAGATVTSSAKQNIVYTVTGTGVNSCTNTFNVTTVVTPINISPPTATFCAGGYVSLATTGATNCTWSPTSGLTPSTGPAVTAKPTVDGVSTYTVSGTDPNGCIAKGTLTITVNPLPTFTLPTTPSICKGGSGININASNDVGFNYTWLPATGISNPNSKTVTANPTQTTTYYLSAVHPTTNCSKIGTVTVKVIGTVPPVSQTICAGSPTVLTASGADSYMWSPNIDLNQTAGETVIASPTSDQIYSVTGTSVACGTNPAEFFSVLVTPLPYIDLTPPSASVPLGSSVTLTASGSDNYTWSPATYLNTTNGTTVVSTPEFPITYTVSSTANNCTANKTIFVDVIPAPPGTNDRKAIDFGSGPLPQGTIYSDTKNNNPVNHFWNDMGQPSDDIYYKFTINQASRVKLQHCNTPGTGISDSYMHILDQNSKLMYSKDDYGPLCSSSRRSSMDMGISAGTYYVVSEGYASTFGDIKTELEVLPCSTSQAGSTIANPILISNNIGACYSYYGPLTSNGCMGNKYGYSSEDIIYKFTLSSAQKVNISSCGSTFYDTYITLLNSDGTYRDSNDDEGPLCSGAMTASLSLDLPAGTYYVALEGYANYCGMMSLSLTTPTTSCPYLREESTTDNKGLFKSEVQETDNSIKNLNVYPNPSLGELIVDLKVANEATVVLIDLMGMVVAEKQVPSGSNSFKLEGSHLAKGIYVVKVLGTDLSKSVLIR